MKLDFPHRQSAHCETGVISNMLGFHGYRLTEAMAFGIGSGLFFCYLPFLRIGDLPLTSFRTLPGSVFGKASRRLGLTVERRRYRQPAAGMAALDAALERGIPVGVLTGAWWLPYFPPALRFHFNAHNIVIYGKEGDTYLVSDPVIEEPVTCPAADLLRARYAKGPMSPRGLMYYVSGRPAQMDLAGAIRQGVRETCRTMLAPAFCLLIGAVGIRFLGRRLAHWPERLGPAAAAQGLGNLIRMQEEIGTGGAGFRFLYAAFLQEAADVLAQPALRELAVRLTAIGDRWREFAVMAARHVKGRADATVTYPAMGAVLVEIGEREAQFFRDLRRTLG